MTAYATVSDLQAGWRDLTPKEQEIAGVLLDRASALLSREIGDAVLDDVQIEIAQYIVCDMVRYSFIGASMGAAPTLEDSPSVSAWLPDMEGGSLMVTDRHMRMLGLGRSRAGFTVSS